MELTEPGQHLEDELVKLAWLGVHPTAIPPEVRIELETIRAAYQAKLREAELAWRLETAAMEQERDRVLHQTLMDWLRSQIP